ncbi:MAG: ABC transporter substrate-binding protein [Porphyromonas sp.]|nr:ABC transporter substrate-binding protein [Porphyromonas sp.]
MKGSSSHIFIYSCRIFALLLLAPLLISCGAEKRSYEELLTPSYLSDYSPGFAIYSIEGMESTVIRITNPWQGSEGVSMDAFVERNGEKAPVGFTGQVIPSDPRRIVALSSSYVGMLDFLGEVERVVAVSGKQYITNDFVTDPSHGVVDLGPTMQYEQLLATQPDLVLCYGVDDAEGGLTSHLEELGIPYLYMGEYLEEDPLGRAEWVMVLAELFDLREKAVEAFEEVEQRYLATMALTQGLSDEQKPKVMLNMPWNDAWFLPTSNSYIVRIFEDAGATPITGGTARGETKTIGMEQALLYLSEAAFWLHPGQARGYGDLPAKIREHKAQVRPIREDHIYNNNARTTPAGGSDYWESGVMHPEVILADLVSIFHPELIDHELYYYHKIEVQ